MKKLSKGLSYLKLQTGKLLANRFSSTGDALAMQNQYSVLPAGKGLFFKSLFVLVV